MTWLRKAVSVPAVVALLCISLFAARAQAQNNPPIADDQAVSTDEDVPVDIVLTATDPDGDDLSFAILGQPSNGTLTGIPPEVTYTPNLNYSGVDSFTFLASDDEVGSNVATVTVTVVELNDAPTADDLSVVVAEDEAASFTLTGGDAEGSEITFSLVVGPTNGSLSGDPPALTYTPNPNYFGLDSFTFVTNDGELDSEIATVSIDVLSVNDAPVAEDVDVETPEDQTVAFELVVSDADLDPLSYSIQSGPTSGSLSGPAPNLVYTPNADFNGIDSFTYAGSDGEIVSNIATVTITVTPVNDPPVADDQSVVVAEDTPVAITLTGTDIDDPVLDFQVVDPPVAGVLSGVAPNLVYTPNPNTNGPDQFTFNIDDGEVVSNLATVSITVTAGNDPPVGDPQSVTTDEDVALAIVLTGSDPDGDALAFSVTVGPEHGELSGFGANLVYEPDADYNGPDSLQFTANDGQQVSPPAVVDITVNPINDPPVAEDQSVQAPQDGSLEITLVATDVEQSALTYVLVDEPTNGTLSGLLPLVTYTPNSGFEGSDSFTFRANDGELDSNLATVSIEVLDLIPLDLGFSGSCPGDVTVSVTGMTPNADMVLLWAPDGGDMIVPVSDCAGTQLDLGNGTTVLTTVAADANGEIVLDRTLPVNGCGILLQSIDLNSCDISNVVQTPSDLVFSDVTSAAGIAGTWESDLMIPIGGGTIWADFNDDGWDDVYLVGASVCNVLAINNQDGTFSQLVDAAGASDCTGVSHGAAAADFDNDGDQDLYVTNNGPNRLFVNQLQETGSVAFIDRTVEAGIDTFAVDNSSSASWGDYDNDGLLDLVVLQHFVPVVDQCLPDFVFHNEGDGTFTEVGAALGVTMSGNAGEFGCGLAVTWSDFDRDGDADLFIVNDLGGVHVPNVTFRNDGPDGLGGWIFTDVSVTSGLDYEMYGMGIAMGDYDRDGDLDYYMSDIGQNNFAQNNGDGTFTDVTVATGTEARDIDIYLGDDGLVSWGNQFFDADLDGWVDLMVANGGSPEEKFPGMFGDDYVDLGPVYFYRNRTDGTFFESHQAVNIEYETYNRSITYVDYDKDGDLDAHVGVVQGENTLYRNDLERGSLNWLGVKVQGTTSNRDGIGALVEAEIDGLVLIREIDGGSSFLSRSSLTAHFGLGDADVVDVLRVTFPSGAQVELTEVAVNQEVLVVEP